MCSFKFVVNNISVLRCRSVEVKTRVRRPQTNGMVERFNGRIADILRTHHFQSGKELEHTLLRYVDLYNNHLPQANLNCRTPYQVMYEWYENKPQFFDKVVHNRPEGDTYTSIIMFICGLTNAAGDAPVVGG